MKLDEAMDFNLRGIVCVIDTSKGTTSLVKSAALRGFCGMTCNEMERLIRDADVPYDPPKPQLEKDLATLLIRWAHPKISDVELEQALGHRRAKSRKRHDNVLDETNSSTVEGMAREDDVAMVKETVAKVASQALLSVAKGVATMEVAPAADPAASSSAASSSKDG